MKQFIDLKLVNVIVENDLITLLWKDVVSQFKDYKKDYTKCFHIARDNNIKKVISDASKHKMLTQEHQEFQDTFILGKAVEIGMTHIAIVLPETLYGRFCIEVTKEAMPTNIKMGVYKLLGEAIDFVNET